MSEEERIIVGYEPSGEGFGVRPIFASTSCVRATNRATQEFNERTRRWVDLAVKTAAVRRPGRSPDLVACLEEAAKKQRARDEARRNAAKPREAAPVNIWRWHLPLK